MTVGSNPRALKRLLNSLSLISCINAEKNNEDGNALDDEIELLINFAMVSIQVAYPLIYRLLAANPNFENWNESVALNFNLKPLDDEIKTKLALLEEFDEEWEQVLFRLCETDYFLKKRALHISRLLNMLRAMINEHKMEVGETIESIISLSSVTSLEAFDTPVVEYDKNYWQEKSSETALAIVNAMLGIINKFKDNACTLQFFQQYIDVRLDGKREKYLYFSPKKKFVHIRYEKVSAWVNEWLPRLETAGVQAKFYANENKLRVTIHSVEEIEQHRALLEELTQFAIAHSE